jgi:hypothetical protein
LALHGEALAAKENTRDRWFGAEVHRVAGELALASPESDVPTAPAYFERRPPGLDSQRLSLEFFARRFPNLFDTCVVIGLH